MADVFRVWVTVERDHGNEQYEEVTEPECIGKFSTDDEAIAFIASLPQKFVASPKYSA